MPQFAANLSFLYPDLPFLQRFEAAAADGFKAVEYLFPYAYAPRELAELLQRHGLKQALFNAPPGGVDAQSIDAAWAAGARGTACVPGKEDEFREGITFALSYANALRCDRIHVMAGLLPAGSTREQVQPTYVANLKWASALAAQQDCQVLIEPINGRDIPGFFLNRQDHAHDILAQVGAPNLKVQMDLYHCQIVEGDLAMKLKKYLPTGNIGHIQIAGVPERHEPDIGELNYSYLFQLLDSEGYRGYLGCEYRPRRGSEPGGTSAGLGWLQAWL